MSISRNTFDPDKNYKRERYHQDRDLLDSELNEQQDILTHEQRKITDTLLQEGAIISGFVVTMDGNELTIADGVVFIEGYLETVPGAVLVYDSSLGPHYVYVELIKYNYGKDQDEGLVNPATGEATAEREKWTVTLVNKDTIQDALPNHAIERKTVPIYKVELESGLVTPITRRISRLQLNDLQGTLPGDKITVSSITENQISTSANEGKNSLMQNLAERTYDQSGSFVVEGMDSFIGQINEDTVEVVTNAGRAYVHGYRVDRDLPTTTIIPKSTATQAVYGELKTFFPNTRVYPLDHAPMHQSTRVQAIMERTANITRGPNPGGTDLLVPNPVVDIMEIKQGATVYQKNADWQQSGNHVDWLSSGNEPAGGSTYSVRWFYSKEMTKDVDYVDGSWFGRPDHPEGGLYYYFITAIRPAGESPYLSQQVVSRDTAPGDINVITWNHVDDASAYRIYRAQESSSPSDLQLLQEVGSDTLEYDDVGVDEIIGGNPPMSGSFDMNMYPLGYLFTGVCPIPPPRKKQVFSGPHPSVFCCTWQVLPQARLAVKVPMSAAC